MAVRSYAPLGFDPAVVDTGSPTDGAPFPKKLGECAMGSDGTEWTYVLADTAISQYDAVGIAEDWGASPLTKAMADDGWMIGFAQVAIAAASYGWVATKGSTSDVKVNVLADCAPDVKLYTSATAGSLDDSSTSQTNIAGIVTISTATTATSIQAIITYPRSGTF